MDGLAGAAPHAPAAARIEAERQALADEILFRKYLQWVAGEQWRPRASASNGVALFGDLPFMVSGDSADVWARQDEFRLDASVGVPPDAFSATGTGLGPAAVSLGCAAASATSTGCGSAPGAMAHLFDGYRVDHLVGFYRTYVRPRGGGDGVFTPADEPSQHRARRARAGRVPSTGAEIIAEDLGTVPDFVRESLARLGIPGYKVFRWERHWHAPGQPFRDPPDYPAVGGGHVRHARHRADGDVVGRARRQRSAARCSRFRRSAID